MLKVAVTVVAFTATTLVTVMPLADTFTAVTVLRFVPVRVTGTAVVVVPLLAESGLIEVSVGAGAVLAPWNSTAPISKKFGWDGSGRGRPKKSRARAGLAVVGRLAVLSGT